MSIKYRSGEAPRVGDRVMHNSSFFKGVGVVEAFVGSQCTVKAGEDRTICLTDNLVLTQRYLRRSTDFHEKQRQFTAPLSGYPDTEPLKDTNPKTQYGLAKPQIGLMPGAALIEVAKAMEEGNRKYGPANWREDPVSFSTYYHAALRHMQACWDGEDLNDESKAHHFGHAIANLAIILDAKACKSLVDDRPPPGATAALIKENTHNAS